VEPYSAQLPMGAGGFGSGDLNDSQFCSSTSEGGSERTQCAKSSAGQGAGGAVHGSSAQAELRRGAAQRGVGAACAGRLLRASGLPACIFGARFR
jgi:hypothetical protein